MDFRTIYPLFFAKRLPLKSSKQIVVIDPVAGSGSTLIAAENLGRKAYGFEIKKDFVRYFNEKMKPCVQPRLLMEAV